MMDKTEPAPTIEPVGDDNTGGNNASGSSGQAEHTNVPKVGDHMDSIALICVLVIAMAAIGAVVVAKRRRKAEWKTGTVTNAVPVFQKDRLIEVRGLSIICYSVYNGNIK